MESLSRIKITDGVNLTVIPSGKFKSNLFTVNFIRPLDRGEAGANALLFEVLKRGTRTMDMAAITDRQYDLYGAELESIVRKKGALQCFGFASEFLASKFALSGEDMEGEVADLMAELIFDPRVSGGAFDGDIVKNEKRNLADRILALSNDKTSYASRRLIECMCEGEPVSVCEYGDVDTVSRITPDSLYEQYRKVVATSAVELVFVGSCDAGRLAESLAGKFPDGEREKIATPMAFKGGEELRRVTEEQSVSQSKLSMGFRTGITTASGEYPALTLFSMLFGAHPGSRLFLNVRERLSLCYYCASRFDRFAGIMEVLCGIESGNRERAEDEIMRQFALIKKGDYSDDELDVAKKVMQNAYRTSADSLTGSEDWYLNEILSGREIRELGEMPGIIAEVTRRDIDAASENIELDTVYFLTGKGGGE